MDNHKRDVVAMAESVVQQLNKTGGGMDTITAIIELGEIYKKNNPSWLYGDLEQFVVKNVSSLLEYWYTKGDEIHTELDTVCEEWYEQQNQ